MVTIDLSFQSAFEIEEPPWDDDSKVSYSDQLGQSLFFRLPSTCWICYQSINRMFLLQFQFCSKCMKKFSFTARRVTIIFCLLSAFSNDCI